MKAISDRVTLRADDALIAFNCLRTCIRKSDKFLATSNGSGHDFVRSYRAEKWEAYQRIAKALGLQPTLDKVKELAPE